MDLPNFARHLILQFIIIESYLYNLLQYDKNIATISIYTNNSVIHKGPNINRISKVYRYENEEWFKRIKENDGLQLIDTYKSHINPFSNEQIIFLGRALKNMNENRYIGMIIIELKTGFLDDIIKEFDFTNNVSILLMDDSYNLIYNKSSDGEKINVSEILHGKSKNNYFIISSKSSFTDWNLFYILPYKSIFNELYFLQYFFTTISAASILFTLFISNLVSYRISGRVKNILSAMNKAQNGIFDITIDDKETDELSLISEAFNKTMKKIRKIIDDVYISELKHKEAQLDYLQRQINPHFIYNTLENIKMLGVINDQEEIVTTAEALGKLLRYNASGGRKNTSINEELSHVMSYLQIQKLRYGDKIKVNIDVHEDIRENDILKFTLQPLVENAVHHGIELKKGGGTITIRGYMKEGKACIDIIDDGKGIPKEKLDELNSKLDIKNSYNKRSIGIFNVNERIKLFYGNPYGLSIKSDYNIGTTVTITLPYKKYTPNLE